MIYITNYTETRVPIVSSGQNLLRRALSIRDDKRPREKVWSKFNIKLVLSLRAQAGMLIDIALISNINTTGTWLNV